MLMGMCVHIHVRGACCVCIHIHVYYCVCVHIHVMGVHVYVLCLCLYVCHICVHAYEVHTYMENKGQCQIFLCLSSVCFLIVFH